MSDAQTSRPVHVRTIRVEVARGRSPRARGHRDPGRRAASRNPEWFGSDPPPVIHDMRLGLRVRHPDLVVTEVRSEMASHPYTICPEALPPLQQLVGLSIARGFTREVNERFGRQRGCAHFTALIHAMAPAVRQGAGAAFPEQERPAAGDPWFVNTCQAWREEGPLHRLIRAGDEASLRALSAFAPEAGADRSRRARGRAPGGAGRPRRSPRAARRHPARPAAGADTPRRGRGAPRSARPSRGNAGSRARPP